MFDLVEMIEHAHWTIFYTRSLCFLHFKQEKVVQDGRLLGRLYKILMMIRKYNYFKIYHMDLDEIMQMQAYILIYHKKSVKVS